MSIRSFVRETAPSSYRIAVQGPEAASPLSDMLGDVFDGQVPVEQLSNGSDDSTATHEDGMGAALLFDGEQLVATSPLSELYDSILAINSDLFITGARPPEDVELPAVIQALTDTRFRLRGYPLAHKEKLLLIVLSRWIERRALEAETGSLRSSFQRLSRIDDEIGTTAVYRGLAAAPVDVHVYGSGEPPANLEITAHAGTTPEYRHSWFVVYHSEDRPSTSAALVCYEDEPRVWDGFFTDDSERVAVIDGYIAQSL